MTLAALILLAFGLVAALGVITYMVIRETSLVDQLLAARDQSAQNALAAERAKFDGDKASQALAGEKARADALEQYIAHDARPAGDPSALAPDDIAGRVRLISQQWAAANVPGGPGEAGAVAAGDVHPSAPAGTT